VTDDPWFTNVGDRFERLGWLALAGGLLLASCALLPEGSLRTTAIVLGIVLFLPWFVYVYLLTVWHWKERYRGTHSRLWGAILLIETSGWSKILYWFRHIVPDWRGTGRYRRPLQSAAQDVEHSA
jgi:hypothetical protein